MANFIENNLQFHIFSKSPVSPETTLGMALNKSGHTLTTDDMFGEELPAFYSVSTITERDSLKANFNDLCKIGVDIYYYDTEWKPRNSIADGECLFNHSSKLKNNGTDYVNNESEAVVKFHKEKSGVFITEENNGVSGNKYTVRVKDDESGNFIKQFISCTDKIVGNYTSLGYTPLVK